MKNKPVTSRLGGFRSTRDLAPLWAYNEPDKYTNQMMRLGAWQGAFWGFVLTLWCGGLGAFWGYKDWRARHYFYAVHSLENLVDDLEEQKQTQKSLGDKATAAVAKQEKQAVRARLGAMTQDPLFQALKSLKYTTEEATMAYHKAPLEGETGPRLMVALQALAKVPS